MHTRRPWLCLCLLAVSAAVEAQQADFPLTRAETSQLEAGGTVIRAELDSRQRGGTVRAAMWIAAPPATVFRAMTVCQSALQYVPHLQACRVRAQSADGITRLVEHEVDLGWYAPRMRYVFSADVEAERRVHFRQVSGDFRANEGVWELEADASGRRTLLRYRLRIDPPGYVPDWLARSLFRRELPQMLADLRRHCESAASARAEASVPAG